MPDRLLVIGLATGVPDANVANNGVTVALGPLHEIAWRAGLGIVPGTPHDQLDHHRQQVEALLRKSVDLLARGLRIVGLGDQPGRLQTRQPPSGLTVIIGPVPGFPASVIPNPISGNTPAMGVAVRLYVYISVPLT